MDSTPAEKTKNNSSRSAEGGFLSPFVEMRGIWKSFPGVVANKNINLDLMVGEVHSLLGENGAGKSTLMRILSGLYQPDQGEIIIEDKPTILKSPGFALRAGIGMVHQNFRLVSTLTAAENIHLGWEKTPEVFSQEELSKRTKEICAANRLAINPDVCIFQMSVGEQQRVEILKVLARGVRLLILDEPTSVLTPQEAEDLFKILRGLASEGHTIIFISHKLDEVLSVSDRITVLRGGEKVGTCNTSDCTHQSLAQMMVGKQVEFGMDFERVKYASEIVIQLEKVEVLNDLDFPALKNINLNIRAGEVLGVAGVSGNGQTELAEVLTGLRKIHKGRIELDGENVTDWTPVTAATYGIGHIPEDRKGYGLITHGTVTDNAILREYVNPPITKGFRLFIKEARKYAQSVVDQGGVMTPNLDTQVRLLSGGNQQRLLAKREILKASRLLIVVHPTSGLDLVATAELRQSIIDYRNQGGAVLLISDDLDEVLMMSDRVIVMCSGEIVGESSKPRHDRDAIGLMMGGEIMASNECL